MSKRLSARKHSLFNRFLSDPSAPLINVKRFASSTDRFSVGRKHTDNIRGGGGKKIISISFYRVCVYTRPTETGETRNRCLKTRAKGTFATVATNGGML